MAKDIHTKVTAETHLGHHHGDEVVPMERLGDQPPPERHGEKGWSKTEIYLCTRCHQKVTLDIVGAVEVSELDDEQETK